jgi:hypothetical protein
MKSDLTIVRLGTHQNVAFTGTAGNSTAFTSKSGTIRVVATQACFIAIGTGVTATASSIYLPANVVQYFTMQEGERISAIQVSAGGNLHVTECTR